MRDNHAGSAAPTQVRKSGRPRRKPSPKPADTRARAPASWRWRHRAGAYQARLLRQQLIAAAAGGLLVGPGDDRHLVDREVLGQGGDALDHLPSAADKGFARQPREAGSLVLRVGVGKRYPRRLKRGKDAAVAQ